MDNYVGQPSPRKIIDIYREIVSGIVKLSPDFQRKFVWNDKHKESFLETILKKYPFPEVYIADGIIDTKNKTTEKWVVDGQQRLSTIVDYIDGKDMKLSKIRKFKDLSEEEQKDFLRYPIVVRDLGNIDITVVKEIFKRINSVNYALNSMEIKNALYDGEYISTAKEILQDNAKFFEKFDIFSTNETSRMKDLEFILTTMTTIENNGYFNSIKENEKYIEIYNEEYENKLSIKKLFQKTYTYIAELDLNPYSIWQKKSNIFTLIIEFAYIITDKEIDNTKMKSILEKFEDLVLTHKNNNQDEDIFAKYYINSLQGTNSKQARIARGKILRDYIIENLK